MFRNYFTIALRNIARNRVFSLINIVGLSLGLACCLLILLYAKDELSFDRFQKNDAQLYRITRHLVDKKHSVDRTMGISGMIQGPAFKSAIPGIAAYVRTNPNRLTLRNGKETFQQWVTWVDDNFFTVFSFPLLSGNAEKCSRCTWTLPPNSGKTSPNAASTRLIPTDYSRSQRSISTRTSRVVGTTIKAIRPTPIS